MVTCDSFSSYSLHKLGSGAARTCASELGKEPWGCCRGHGSWQRVGVK